MDRFRRSIAALSVLFAASSAWSQPAQPAPAPAPVPPAPAPAAPPPANLPPTAPAAQPTPPAPATSPPPGGGSPVVLAPTAEPVPPPGAAPPPPPPPPPVEPVAVAPAPAPAPEPPPPPDKLSVGKNNGFFQPSVLLQAWAFSQNDSVNPHTTTLRLRRAELKAKGDIVPKLVSYQLMIDFAKFVPAFSTQSLPVEDATGAPVGSVDVQQPVAGGDQSVLQDFFITFQSDYADVSVGQFKIPVGYEASRISSSKLILPERALVGRRSGSPTGGTYGYGDNRELGIKVEKKIGKYFYYNLGIYNGSGINRLDNDNEKDFGARLEVYPVDGLTIGGVAYTTVGDRDNAVRDRLEGDIYYDANDLYVGFEYIQGWDSPNNSTTAKLEGRGLYGALGYTFIKRIQPVFRLGTFDPNISADNDPDNDVESDDNATSLMFYEGGVNYLLAGNEAKLQLAIGAFDPGVEGQPTVWQYTLAAQASF